MKGTKRWSKVLSLFLVLVSLATIATGCTSGFDASNSSKTVEAVVAAMEQVKSVETSITLDMQGRFSSGLSVDSTSHSAAISSTVTIESSFSPMAYHGQYYSSILVDGAVTREERECYVVPNSSDHVRYEYDATSGNWTQSKVLRTDALAIPRQTGLIYDWNSFMSSLSYQEKNTDSNGKNYAIYSGEVDKAVLEELFGNNVFGSFTYSLEWLLKDKIPCTLYIDTDTARPDHFTLTFTDSFLSSDMSMTLAEVTVHYSNWDNVSTIDAPKRVTVVASNPEAEFYANYYVWNLFLPYVGGQIDGSGNGNRPDTSFTASWDSFQVRIDGGMTSVPLAYEDLQKVGYAVDEKYSGLIVEPNKYKEGVVLCKGSDSLTVTVYNDDTVAQPVTSCKICCLDYSSAQIPNNGIKIFFPGEITLGVSKDTLISAYGDPDEEKNAFSCDTYTWNGKSDMQSLLAEISPTTGQVIRLKVCNIPVTGGEQK